MFKHLFVLAKLLKYDPSQCNTVDKQCCLDFDVACRVYLDTSNVVKLHHWFTIALII